MLWERSELSFSPTSEPRERAPSQIVPARVPSPPLFQHHPPHHHHHDVPPTCSTRPAHQLSPLRNPLFPATTAASTTTISGSRSDHSAANREAQPPSRNLQKGRHWTSSSAKLPHRNGHFPGVVLVVAEAGKYRGQAGEAGRIEHAGE